MYKRKPPRLTVGADMIRYGNPRLCIHFNAAMVDFMGWEEDERVAIICNHARTECRLRLTPVGADTLNGSAGNLRLRARIAMMPMRSKPLTELVDFTISQEGDILFPLPRWAWRPKPMVPPHAGPVIPFGAKRKAMLDMYDRRPVE